MNTTTAALMSRATDTLTAQSPVVAAACRWVAAETACNAAILAYDSIRESDPPLPEVARSDAMSAAVEAQRVAWYERRAATGELIAQVQRFNANAGEA